MDNRFRGTQRAFTLIELLVVVAIIGILAAIALPKLFTAICRSKVGQVDGVIGSLNGALAMYFSDKDGQYPYEGTGTYSASVDTVTATGLPLFCDTYMVTPSTPWSGKYEYSAASTDAYTLCGPINGGKGCDGTTGQGGDGYRYYSSLIGKVGWSDVASTAGC